MAYAWYTKARGLELTSLEQHWSRSDTVDVAFYRRSLDNGATWPDPVQQKTGERSPAGMWRRHPRCGWVDPGTGRLLEFALEGVLPTDDPLEGLRQWSIRYRVDGGAERPLVHTGAEFSAEHPLPGVFKGKNCAMLGDMGSQPLRDRDSILMPVDITLIGADGKLANPGGGYTYHDCAVLHARWRGRDLEWRMSGAVKGDPSRTTRGVSEPTLGRLSKGRLLLVMRGANDRKPTLPSRRWVSFSEDGGWRWSEPRPWTYSNKREFYSPSACSQLLHHSNGRLYWLGNITPENPRGNRPRYPFVVGEVDRLSGGLIEESIRTVDNRDPGESDLLTLSNFYAREDRVTKEILVHMTRLFAFNDGWQGDAFAYRIRV